MENSSKNYILIIVAGAFLVVGLLLSLYSSVIFQEGNPWPQIKGIAHLVFSKSNMVKLSGSENKYITNSKQGQEVIKNFMKDEGYEFTEQLGSGYFYKSPTGTSALVVHKNFSRYYSLWTIIENMTNAESDIDGNAQTIKGDSFQDESLSAKIKKCIVMSDMASKEKCTELLKQILDYDSCVSAGFSIMKSNPPQCATPDGRTFIQVD